MYIVTCRIQYVTECVLQLPPALVKSYLIDWLIRRKQVKDCVFLKTTTLLGSNTISLPLLLSLPGARTLGFQGETGTAVQQTVKARQQQA